MTLASGEPGKASGGGGGAKESAFTLRIVYGNGTGKTELPASGAGKPGTQISSNPVAPFDYPSGRRDD